MKPFCALFAAISLITLSPVRAETELPVGGNPPAIESPHFPDRLHAVVWRNWDLVPTERIARTVGATEPQVSTVAASMGLQPNHPVAPRHQKQVYITVLRRNWHLLPYDQLLTMLDMTAEALAFGLREDDFLYHKLGQLKPKCDPVRYAEPDEAAKRGAAEIKAVVEKHFGDALKDQGEERFAFIKELSSTKLGPSPTQVRLGGGGLRYIYSYFGVFGDPLLDPKLDPYPDGLLARLAEVGVNGVWLHVVLRQLAPGGAEFPEFGQGHETRLENLRELVERAKKHGISVYLYMNEPRAQPPSFFEKRSEMAGIREGDFIAMCTTNPQVRKWISDSLAHVFKEVPGLGGVFTITASENLTNCMSHFTKQNCPRCKDREDADIVGEVNAAIEEGVHRGNPDAKVMCWDWGWNLHKEAPDYIAKTPANTWIQSVSEWAQPFERDGVKGEVGEYAMSVVGPGPRALLHWRLAKERGLKTVARVSFNNTWELSAVPYLPVLDLVAEHCKNLAAVNVDGLMLSWSTGGYPSLNLRVAQRMLGQNDLDVDRVLDEIAAEHYGKEAAPHVRKAWTAFSTAFEEFPYGLGLYAAPMQYGPMNLLYAERTGYGATMVGFPYDDVRSWSGIYPPEVLAQQFQKVADGWVEGLKHMQAALDAADPSNRDTIDADLKLAEAAYTHFAACANQTRFILARDALAQKSKGTGDQHQEIGKLKELLAKELDAEIDLAKRLYPLTKADSRIGFEASNHYYYTPLDLVEKVINCEHLRQRYEK